MVSGAVGWLASHDARDLTAVAIAPDLGERYLDTIYQTNWLQDLYGPDVIGSDVDPRALVSLTTAPGRWYVNLAYSTDYQGPYRPLHMSEPEAGPALWPTPVRRAANEWTLMPF